MFHTTITSSFSTTLGANAPCSSCVQDEVDGDTGKEPSGGLETQDHEQSDDDDIVAASSEVSSTSISNDALFSLTEMLNMTDEALRSPLEVSWGKRLAVLNSGFIGIVPSEGKIGDMAYVLMGCSLPLIVRKGDLAYHILIGESYFHGVTEGELVAGHQEVLENISFE